MAAARFLLAGAILYVFALRTRAGGGPGRADWTWAFATGIPLLLVGNGGVVWAQQTVPSGIAALVIATVPLWIAILDRAFFGGRLSVQALAGIALGFGGVALLVGPTGSGDADPLGAVTLVVAALGWATGTLLSRRGGPSDGPLLGPAMQMLAGGAALVVAGVAAGELGDVDPGAFSVRSAVAFAYLIGFGSIVAFTAYTWLLRNARTSLVATYAYVNPVVAVLLGWAMLDESISSRTLLAGGVIVAAVALIVSAPAHRERRARQVAVPVRAR